MGDEIILEGLHIAYLPFAMLKKDSGFSAGDRVNDN
jgi:hypothetical protein